MANIDRKKRVLFVNEASPMHTGFSKIGKEIMIRLFDTNKYELAELGAYMKSSDPETTPIPWKFYGGIPEENNKLANDIYNHVQTAQFGEAVFEQVCIDFKPDIVCEIRDEWMSSFQANSPFRKYFKWVYMPTVDGIPQRSEWLPTYQNADVLLSYSRFGKEVLEQEGFKVRDIVRPGVNHLIFRPLDKKFIRKAVGISPDANILMSVMRNQRRKLFPDLMEMFVTYLKKCVVSGNEQLACNTSLYLHTSYPDVGFDIAKHLIYNGIGHKVLFTYKCSNCKCWYPSFFEGELTICKRCGELAAHMPNTGNGLTDHQLAEVYNLADLYIQYSICLAKGEKILSQNGWQPIERIQIGDKVLTHQGKYEKVLDTFVNPYRGNMQKLSLVSNYHSLQITDNHPVLSLSKNDVKLDEKKNLREYCGDLLRANKQLPHPKFNSLKDLSSKDLVYFPIDDSVKDVYTVDLASYIGTEDTYDDQYIYVKKGHVYPRHIDVDDSFCKFIGLFAADGTWNASCDSVQITSNINEIANIELSSNFFSKISNKTPTIRKYENRKAVDIICCSSIIKRFFKEHFSKHENKKLPDFVEYLPIEKQRAVLIGMFMGDGHTSYKKATYSLYCTISKVLALQLENILKRLRINYSVRIINKKCNDGKNRKPQYTFRISGDLKNNIMSSERHNTRSFYHDHYHILQIKDIADLDYSETEVYNIEVENDNSYVTHIGAVHNCEGLSCPIAEAKATGVPAMAIDYSAMSEQVEVDGCQKLKVGKFFWETVIETEQKRALPDQDDAATKVFEFFKKTKDERAIFSEVCRKDAAENYSFDRAAKIFESTFDSIEMQDENQTWLNPKFNFAPLDPNISQTVDNADFIDWCIDNIAGRPELKKTYFRDDLVKSLNVGFQVDRSGNAKYDRNVAVSQFRNMGERQNFWERMRVSSFTPQDPKRFRWSMV